MLFGAGAAMSWGAPGTYELTQLVRKSGYFTVSGDTTITEFIYQQLLKQPNYTENDINFETIINAIEELIVYYSYFDGQRKLPSILNTYFSSRFEDEILNFSIEGGNASHGFKLQIPKGKSSEFAKSAFNFETPEQFFLQQLLAKVLTPIVTRITQYSYHTRNKTNVLTEANLGMNDLFARWIQRISSHSVIRLYTLNYDRNFKVILEHAPNPVSLFEGFDSKATIEYGSRLRADVKSILSNKECHCHYNLHGSVFWDVEARDQGQLPNPCIYLTEGPRLTENSYEYAIWQSEKGKTLLLTNIITGYQKVQRGIFAPFRQMQAAFDSDCSFADTIFVVGYSFGDEHINASVRTALQYNKDLKVVIVDPGFQRNDQDLQVAINIFSSAGDSHQLKPRTIEKDLHSFFDGKFLVHTKTFQEFMESSVSK